MRFISTLLLACVLSTSPAFAGGMTLETTEQNVVANRLEGTWRPKAELNKSFLSKPRSFADSMTFTRDDTVASLIPKVYVERLKQLNVIIYMAGYMTLEFKTEKKRFPFILSSLFGNPHILFWLEKKGELFGDSESFNVMLATSGEASRDLLFVGGDQAQESFIALERVPEATE